MQIGVSLDVLECDSVLYNNLLLILLPVFKTKEQYCILKTCANIYRILGKLNVMNTKREAQMIQSQHGYRNAIMQKQFYNRTKVRTTRTSTNG